MDNILQLCQQALVVLAAPWQICPSAGNAAAKLRVTNAPLAVSGSNIVVHKSLQLLPEKCPSHCCAQLGSGAAAHAAATVAPPLGFCNLRDFHARAAGDAQGSPGAIVYNGVTNASDKSRRWQQALGLIVARPTVIQS